jgi:PAS domain S-box-containing protein
MKKKGTSSQDADTLRQKAEELLKIKSAGSTIALAESDALRLLHELEVHQIELELQNKDLVQAKETERITAEKYIALYDFAPTGYFTLSTEGNIINLNLTGAKLLGKERGHLKKSRFNFFISDDTAHIFNRFFEKVFSGKSKEFCEIRIKTPDDTPLFVQLIGITDSNRELCFLAAVDITQRRLAEDVLKEREIQLRELNATKDKFFFIIAHDLKNPFNSILGFCELLKREIEFKDFEAVEQYADIIYSGVDRTLKLLENLLTWARAQQGKIPFVPKSILLNKIVDSQIEDLRCIADRKNIRLFSNFHQKITIIADENMIKTILRNLISNAIKFTDKNGTVGISAEVKNGNVETSVLDDGMGMTSEEINNLFKMETSFSTPGTENERGSGLGLLLCMEFVKKHNGKIWVDSEPGKGSVFKFTIPM